MICCQLPMLVPKLSQKFNPKSNPELVKKKREESQKFLKQNQAEIEAGQVVVFFMSECHLLGDDVCGYVWGKTDIRIKIPIKNIKDRQTPEWSFKLSNKRFYCWRVSSGEFRKYRSFSFRSYKTNTLDKELF
jgi:putative transposase